MVKISVFETDFIVCKVLFGLLSYRKIYNERIFLQMSKFLAKNLLLRKILGPNAE